MKNRKHKKTHAKTTNRPILAKTLRAAVSLTRLPAHVVQAAKSAGCQAFKSNGTVNCEELLAFVAKQPQAQGTAPDFFVERALDVRANRLLKEQKLREREKVVVPMEEVRRYIVRTVIVSKNKFQFADAQIVAEAGMKFALPPATMDGLREIIRRHRRQALQELHDLQFGEIKCPHCQTEIKEYEK